MFNHIIYAPYITRYVSGRAFRSLIRSQTVVSRGFGQFQESESDFADPHLDLDLDLDSWGDGEFIKRAVLDAGHVLVGKDSWSA